MKPRNDSQWLSPLSRFWAEALIRKGSRNWLMRVVEKDKGMFRYVKLPESYDPQRLPPYLILPEEKFSDLETVVVKDYPVWNLMLLYSAIPIFFLNWRGEQRLWEATLSELESLKIVSKRKLKMLHKIFNQKLKEVMPEIKVSELQTSSDSNPEFLVPYLPMWSLKAVLRAWLQADDKNSIALQSNKIAELGESAAGSREEHAEKKIFGQFLSGLRWWGYVAEEALEPESDFIFEQEQAEKGDRPREVQFDRGRRKLHLKAPKILIPFKLQTRDSFRNKESPMYLADTVVTTRSLR